MKSDICYLEFTINSDGSQPICRIDFCSVCESESICKVCDPLIEDLKIDMDIKSETFGNCICDENNGHILIHAADFFRSFHTVHKPHFNIQQNYIIYI